MTATYPSSIRSFSTKRNILDVVDAADPNGIQEELIAIESILGVNPHISTAPSSSGTFVTTSTPYVSLTARLANIETGIVADSHTQYLRRTGNEIIVNATSTNVPLTIKGASGQTSNLLELKDSSNNTVVSVSPTGTLSATFIDSKQFTDLIIASLWA